MTKFTQKNCHYFGETKDENANVLKGLMALAAPIIVSKGTVTKQWGGFGRNT